MIDVDSPSRTDRSFGPFLHWLVFNIPTPGDWRKGDQIVEYVGTGPTPGTGLHRYVILVYKQPQGKRIENITETRATNKDMAGRPHFDLKQFLTKYGFTEPAWAGNFFQSRFDDYVPLLHAQLGSDRLASSAEPEKKDWIPVQSSRPRKVIEMHLKLWFVCSFNKASCLFGPNARASRPWEYRWDIKDPNWKHRDSVEKRCWIAKPKGILRRMQK